MVGDSCQENVCSNPSTVYLIDYIPRLFVLFFETTENEQKEAMKVNLKRVYNKTLSPPTLPQLSLLNRILNNSRLNSFD